MELAPDDHRWIKPVVSVFGHNNLSLTWETVRQLPWIRLQRRKSVAGARVAGLFTALRSAVSDAHGPCVRITLNKLPHHIVCVAGGPGGADHAWREALQQLVPQLERIGVDGPWYDYALYWAANHAGSAPPIQAAGDAPAPAPAPGPTAATATATAAATGAAATAAGAGAAEGEAQCKVCFDSAVEAVLSPCGHEGLCMGCAEALSRRGDSCPFCRSPIERVIRVYKS
eukprot:m51a1_g12353 putative xb3 isoform 1 (228) ;mRNA; r:543722-544504